MAKVKPLDDSVITKHENKKRNGVLPHAASCYFVMADQQESYGNDRKGRDGIQGAHPQEKG